MRAHIHRAKHFYFPLLRLRLDLRLTLVMLLMEADVIEDVTIIITMMKSVVMMVMAVVQDSASRTQCPGLSVQLYSYSVCCSSHCLSDSCSHV